MIEYLRSTGFQRDKRRRVREQTPELCSKIAPDNKVPVEFERYGVWRLQTQ
jgi:hypothetical protein